MGSVTQQLKVPGLLPDTDVKLYAMNSRGDRVAVGIGVLFGDVNRGTLSTVLHGQPLAQYRTSPSQQLVVVRRVRVEELHREMAYPYKYGGVEEPPSLLGDISLWGMYAWSVDLLIAVEDPAMNYMPPMQSSDGCEGSGTVVTPVRSARVSRVRERIVLESPTPSHVERRVECGRKAGESCTKRKNGDGGRWSTRDGEHEAEMELVEVSATDATATASRDEVRERLKQVLGRKKISLSHYICESVFINLDRITQPKRRVRSLNKPHMVALKESFCQNGVLDAMGVVSVAFRNIPTRPPPYEGQFLDNDLNLVDGGHRTMLLMELKKEDRCKWEPCGARLPAKLWRTKQGRLLREDEILALGNALNASGSTVLRMSFGDKIHSVVSFILIVTEEGNTPIRYLSSGALADSLFESGTIGQYEKRHLRRFAEVALMVVRKPSLLAKVEGLCERQPKLGLTHLWTEALNGFDEGLFSFALECLELYMETKQSFPGGSAFCGRFEGIRRLFYLLVERLYEQAMSFACEHGRTVSWVMEKKVAVSKLNKVTVSRYIQMQTAKVQSVAAGAVESVVAKKVRSLRRKLVKELGEPVPKPHGTDAVEDMPIVIVDSDNGEEAEVTEAPSLQLSYLDTRSGDPKLTRAKSTTGKVFLSPSRAAQGEVEAVRLEAKSLNTSPGFPIVEMMEEMLSKAVGSRRQLPETNLANKPDCGEGETKVRQKDANCASSCGLLPPRDISAPKSETPSKLRWNLRSSAERKVLNKIHHGTAVVESAQRSKNRQRLKLRKMSESEGESKQLTSETSEELGDGRIWRSSHRKRRARIQKGKQTSPKARCKSIAKRKRRTLDKRVVAYLRELDRAQLCDALLRHGILEASDLKSRKHRGRRPSTRSSTGSKVGSEAVAGNRISKKNGDAVARHSWEGFGSKEVLIPFDDHNPRLRVQNFEGRNTSWTEIDNEGPCYLKCTTTPNGDWEVSATWVFMRDVVPSRWPCSGASWFGEVVKTGGEVTTPTGGEHPACRVVGVGDANGRYCRRGVSSALLSPTVVIPEDTKPWLRAIHMPRSHRAALLRGVELEYIHHAVYWHAARLRHKQLGSTKKAVLGVKLPCQGTASSEEHALWMAACERDEFALEVFGEKRMELQERGFCVFEGFADDSGMLLMEPGLRRVIGRGSECLLEYFAKDFAQWHRNKRLRSADGADDEENGVHVWSGIINAGDANDFGDLAEGKSRYITTRYGIVDHIERDADKAWMVVERARLDARIGQLASALRIASLHTPNVGNIQFPTSTCQTENSGSQPQSVGKAASESGSSWMYCPKTGGRIMCTARGCRRQVLHTDSKGLTTKEWMENTNPGYFVIVSGGRAVPLWVCDNSHKLLRRNGKMLSHVSEGFVVRKYWIPPNSLFFGRSDVFHAGASFEECESDEPVVRYHMYLVPEGYALPDAVHRENGFKPPFLNDSDLEILDLKCGSEGKDIESSPSLESSELHVSGGISGMGFTPEKEQSDDVDMEDMESESDEEQDMWRFSDKQSGSTGTCESDEEWRLPQRLRRRVGVRNPHVSDDERIIID